MEVEKGARIDFFSLGLQCDEINRALGCFCERLPAGRTPWKKPFLVKFKVSCMVSEWRERLSSVWSGGDPWGHWERLKISLHLAHSLFAYRCSHIAFLSKLRKLEGCDNTSCQCLTIFKYFPHSHFISTMSEGGRIKMITTSLQEEWEPLIQGLIKITTGSN